MPVVRLFKNNLPLELSLDSIEVLKRYGGIDLTSYCRWNAVCDESRTCGVDLDEIPRGIVRDDESAVNEWVITSNDFNGFTDLSDSVLITEATFIDEPIYRLRDSSTTNYYDEEFKEIEFGGTDYYIYLSDEYGGLFTEYYFYGPYDGIRASVEDDDTIVFTINVHSEIDEVEYQPIMVTTNPMVVVIEEIGNPSNIFYCGLQVDTGSDTPVVVVPVS